MCGDNLMPWDTTTPPPQYNDYDEYSDEYNDDYWREMEEAEAENDAFEKIRKEVPAAKHMLDEVDLECCDWHDSKPADSMYAVVDAVVETIHQFAWEYMNGLKTDESFPLPSNEQIIMHIDNMLEVSCAACDVITSDAVNEWCNWTEKYYCIL